MKKLGIIACSTLLASLMGCGNKEQTAPWTNIDLSGSIPKEERILQDLFEVKYVALETTDSFLTRGFIEAVSPHLLITYDYGEGCLSLFDRATGKGIRQIKRQGQGPEEYVSPSHIIIDEKREELFVSDYASRKILVYDLMGNFKRSFKTVDENYYTELLDYDDGHLLAYKKTAGPHDESSCHLLIAKQDGSPAKEIRFPIDRIETPIFTHGELTATPFFCLTAPYGDRWALTVTSSDTIYRYDADGSAHPLIVRTPSIHGMDPQVPLPHDPDRPLLFPEGAKEGVRPGDHEGIPDPDAALRHTGEKACRIYVDQRRYGRRTGHRPLQRHAQGKGGVGLPHPPGARPGRSS